MTEPLTEEDLSPRPKKYLSSRPWMAVLIGEDTVLPLMEACSTSTATGTILRDLLAQSPWKEAVFETPHCIYHELRPLSASNTGDVRDVLATPWLNLQRLMTKAADTGNAAVVSTILDFASQDTAKKRGVIPSSLIDYQTVQKTIENGNAAVLEVLIATEPSVTTFDLPHKQTPLDLAIKKRQPEVAEVLIRHGAGRQSQGSYGISPLSRAISRASAIGTGTTKLLLQYGAPIVGSGALHTAAEEGNLEIIRLLTDPEYGADLNERLPAATLPHNTRFPYASWTPLHFAAATGKADAMELLVGKGAQADTKDENGKTPYQLLNEQNKTDQVGRCLGYSNTGSMNTCITNIPFEPVAVIDPNSAICGTTANGFLNLKRSDVQAKIPIRGGMGSNASIPAVCRKLDAVGIGGFDYKMPTKGRDEFMDDFFNLSDEKLIQKWVLVRYDDGGNL